MDVGPIPLTAIQDYSDRHQLGDIFVRQIMNMDREFMSDRKKKAKAHG